MAYRLTTPRYKAGKFFCYSPGQLFECRTCRQLKRLERMTKSKFIPGDVQKCWCKDCHKHRATPGPPKSREEINANISKALVKHWDKKGRPSDRLNKYDYRERLPKKKELPASYPVWE